MHPLPHRLGSLALRGVYPPGRVGGEDRRRLLRGPANAVRHPDPGRRRPGQGAAGRRGLRRPARRVP
ncbi:hypothetical protein LT493_31385 [Streptomyces tricolor]|nr:hypothetical protein [Streptomyces tricolor]